jgi:hypothetical protein
LGADLDFSGSGRAHDLALSQIIAGGESDVTTSKSTKIPDSDLPARSADLPLIFRFFNSPENCLTYLTGRWAGVGMQAVHDWPPATRMAMRLAGRSKQNQVRVEISARSPDRSWWSRLLIALRLRGLPVEPFFVEATAERSRAVKDFHAKLEFSPPAEGNRFGADFAQLTTGEWELSLQVLENVRVHAQLRRTDGHAPIYFSGVLKKTR